MKSPWRILKAFFAGPKREADLEREIQFHLSEEAEAQQDQGLSTLEAGYAARRELGNVARLKEEARSAWGTQFIEAFLQDLRISARSFRKNPGFHVLALAVLGLGIGASTAMFSVVNAVILKPLAFPDPDRIVALTSLSKTTNRHFQVSLPDFDDWGAQSHSFESVSWYSSSLGLETSVVLNSGAQFARIVTMSDNFFDTLKVPPAMGQARAPGEERVAIISHSFWQQRMGGDPSALTKTIRVANNSLPIAAIMPAGFNFPERTDIWVPSDQAERQSNPNRGAHNYRAIGRLKPYVDVASVQADMTIIGERLEKQYPGANGGKNVAVTPLGKELVGDRDTMLYVLLGAVFLLLLIATGNVANLMLARAATRTRELGVRTALGAPRSRIVRQLATESLVLGIGSGIAGVAVARFATPVLVAIAPTDIPRLQETGIDLPVLTFAAVLTTLACLLFGLIPALRVARLDVNSALKAGGSRGVLAGGSAVRQALVVTEVAFSVILLTGAGLLIRSFMELSDVPLGFETQQIVMMETSKPAFDEAQAYRVTRSYQELLQKAAMIPGVEAVGAARVPPGRTASDGAYEVDENIARGLSVRSPKAVYSIVSPGAFAVLGIPVRQGRDFSEADTENGPLTAIVNEAVVRETFKGQNPIGHRIMNGMDRLEPMTIVGVVADIRQRGPGEAAQPEIYMPYRQHPRPSTALRILVRISGPREPVVSALGQLARQVSPDMSVRFTDMETRLADVVSAPRFRTLLSAVFSTIAIVLSMAGIYGVVSFLVNQRSREIGVRMALGARSDQVMKMVLTQGTRMTALGVVLGLAGAAASVRYVQSLLFEVKPFDLVTYSAVAGLVALAAVAASWLPARRASKIDPMFALRQE